MGFVALHCGAGNFVNEDNYKILCKRSAKRACKVLESTTNVLDAVETMIQILENNPATNSGYGSSLTFDKTIECEAGVMESRSMNFGACACVNDVKNPISLARKVCDKQSNLLKFGRLPPMLVTGNGASKLAKEFNLELVNPNDLISRRAIQTYNYYRNKMIECDQLPNSSLDTVGAIAVDDFGNIAAGCSSGGILLKTPGRVGQAATYGAGSWSQKYGSRSLGCVTSGNGEYLMKTLLAREVCMNLSESDCPTTKLYQVMNEKFLKSPLLPKNQDAFYAGCLVIDYNCDKNRGDLLWSHTTKMLCLGYKSTKQKSAQFVTSTLPDNLQAGKKVIVGGISF